MAVDIVDIAAQFGFAPQQVSCEPFGRGHIHDSYVLTVAAEAGRRYLLQRINTTVFARPEAVIANVRRVTEHIRQHLLAGGSAEIERRVLTLVPDPAGQYCHRDSSGACWRLYRFIERTRTHAHADTPTLAYAAGQAFGAFQQLLADLPAAELTETIPGFHDTPARFAALDQAIAQDQFDRVAAARPEIAFARQRAHSAGALLDYATSGHLPRRVVHNDAKIDNLLFDTERDVPLCVVDLDTVMPGFSLFDFGDMVRSMTCRAAEDEPDLGRVAVDLDLFAALARGYLQGTGDLLTPLERQLLVTAGRLITLEQGVRFLTDYLRGDVYYKTARPDHNLVRTRTQLRLVESLEQHAATLEEIVARL